MLKPKDTYKRVLSGVLAAVMCAGFVPVGAVTHADSVTDTTTLYVETVNNTTKDPLDNVGVKIECTTAGQYHDYGINYSSSGKIALSVPVGYYRITAASAPEGYRIEANPTLVYVKKTTSSAPVATVVAYANSPLLIQKMDASSHNGVEGAKFTVYDKDHHVVGSGTTAADGYLTIPNLLPGSYTVEETETPAGYHPSPAQNITINSNVTGTPFLCFVDSEKNIVAIRKTDKATNMPLSGAHFKFETATGMAVSGGNDLVTDQYGMVYLYNVAAGDYTLTETQAPHGYLIDQPTTTVNLTQATETRMISVVDSIPGGLTVYSKNSNGEPLAGTQIMIRDNSNHQVGTTLTTDDNGMVFFPNLEPGTYTVIAHKAASGYLLDSNTKQIKIEKNRISDMTFVSAKRPGLIITCEDETGKKLANASFMLKGPNGEESGPFVTNAMGTVQIDNLNAGHYQISQTGVPDGYVVSAAIQNRTMKPDMVENVTFIAKSKPYIEIVHYVRGTATPLAGAKFELWQNNKKITEGTSGFNGIVYFENLLPGQYSVRHVSTADGYTIDTANQNIQVDSGSSGYLQFTSSRNSAILITKVDKATGNPLAGAVFQIKDLQGNVLDTVVTVTDGTATSKVLPAGQYMISEIQAPAGYIPEETSRIVTVVSDQICSQRFVNEKMSAIVISAVDRFGIPVANAKFTVTSLATGKLMDTVVTDKSGVAVTKTLEPGNYIVREASAPAGIVMETQVMSDVVVSTDEATHLTFLHSSQSVIQIRNEDGKGNPISGGQFKVINQNTGDVVGYFTTDDSGIVTTPVLNAGTYQVTQVVAADGYTTKNETYTVVVKDNQASIVRFVNGMNSVLHIKKVDSKTGASLGGVVFTLADESGHVLGRYTTDSSGCLDIKNLKPGNYLLREYQAKDGYVIDEACRTNIVIKADEPTYITVTNTQKPVIQITNEDAQTGDRLSGAEFTIKQNGNVIGIITANQDGLATSLELLPGVYEVFQSKAPSGYTLNPSPVTITLRAGLTSSIVIRNNRTSGLVITKVNELGNPLAGAEFTLYKTNGEKITDLVTEINGTVSYDNIDAGYYILRETKAPAGYKLDTSAKLVQVKADSGAAVKIINKSLSSIVIHKTDADTALPLAGAQFEVTDANNNVVANLRSDKTGLAQTGILKDGTYYVKELAAPDGYTVDTAVRTVTVMAGNTVVLNITNSAKAAIHINLNDAVTGNPLEGGTFVVKVKATGVTVGQGKIVNGVLIIPELPTGDYIVSQISAPNGYVKETVSQDIHVVANKVIDVYFVNQPMTGLKIENVVLTTHKPLAGGVFEVYDASGKQVYHGTSTDTGMLDTGILAPGKYTIKQVATAEGYTIITAVQTVMVTTDLPTTAVFENKPLTSLFINSIDVDTRIGLENTKFRIQSVRGEFEVIVDTDNTGLATVDNLKPGYYIVTEIKAPDDYVLAGSYQFALMRTGHNTELTFTNAKMTGIVIENAVLDTHAPLAGGVFEIWAENTNKKVFEGTTAADGSLQTGTLAPGKYLIKHVATADGYTVMTATQTIEVKTNAASHAVFYNVPTATLEIHAVDEKTRQPIENVTFKVIREDSTMEKTVTTDSTGVARIIDIAVGDYVVTEIQVPEIYRLNTVAQNVKIHSGETALLTFANPKLTGIVINNTDADTGAALQGAKFEIAHLNGKIVGEYITDSSGHIETDPLEPGKYTIKELIAPEGYLRDDAVKTVTVTTDEPTIVPFTNKAKASLIINNVDSNGDPLAGAKFEITLKGVVVGTYTSDNTGKIQTGALKPGEYVIKEVNAPNGYIADTSTKTVTISHTDTVTVQFTNTPKAGIVILNVDAANGEPLEGAHFTVSDENGNIIDEYVTDDTGRIETGKLDPGTYTVKELTAPDGYLRDTAVKTVVVVDTKSTTVRFTNKKMVGIVINMTDAFSGKPLEGAEFEVVDSTGKKVGNMNYVTDASGRAETEALKPGKYTVKLLVAADGYVLEAATRLVTVKNSEPAQVAFTAKPMTTIIINKTDANNGKPLEGAQFDVAREDGTLVGHYTTDSTGRIETKKLVPGNYTIKEMVAPKGYQRDTVMKTVTVTVKDPTIVPFTNKPLTNIVINSVNANGGAALGGAKFEVAHKGGKVVGQFTTGADGQIETGELAPGMYTVKELYAPKDFLRDETIKTVEVTVNEPTIVTFTHRLMTGIVITLKDAATDKPLIGGKFEIVDPSGSKVDDKDFVTDTAGRTETGALKPGKYTVKQIFAPDGYVMDGPAKTVTVKDTEPTIVPFVNRAMSTITVQATDSVDGKPLSGAKFEIYAQSDNTLVGQLTSGVNGSATTIPLVPGKYVVKEIVAPADYLIDAHTQLVDLQTNKSLTITFTHTAKPGLQVETLDAVTKAPLQGATYVVYDKMGTSVGEFTTGQNGVAFVDSLVPGQYRVTQTKAPEGYVIDTATQTINVKAASVTKITFLNRPLTGIVLKLVDNKTYAPLVGGIFEISEVNGNRVNSYTTDSTGVINTEVLNPGKYLIKQVRAPENYLIDDASQIVDVVAGEVTNIRVTNTRKNSLQIWKMDEGNGNMLGGAKFSITNSAGEQITVVETGRDGIAIVPTLKPDKYVVTEIQAPEGYQLDAAPQTIDVKSSNSMPSVLKFYDNPLSSLRIKKIDAKTGEPLRGAEFRIVKENGDYVAELTTGSDGLITIPRCEPGRYIITETAAPIGYIADKTARTVDVKTGVPTVITVENNRTAGIQIRKTVTQTGEPLADVTFKIKHVDGGTVGSYTTDAMGLIYVALDPGEYVVQEVFAPQGYVMNEKPIFVNVGVNDPTVLEVTNDRMSTVRIHKMDAETGAGLYGVTFEIKDMYNNEIGTYKTDDQGYIDLTTVLPDGRYVITEIQTAPGYKLDSVPRTIKVSINEPTVINWTNTRVKGQIEVVKFSADDNKALNIPANTPLAGAEFTIMTTNGQVIDTIKTNDNGVAVSGPLDIGSYIVKETKAPNGYTINDKAVQVNITKTSLKKHVEVYDKSTNVAVNIEKRGESKVRPGNTMKYYFLNVKNASNMPVDNFFFTETLPTDAVRAQTLYTGTWSADTFYKIEYKTNLYDYRTLAQNLNSRTQYSFDLSSQALNMESGEYVTHIRFVFGTVPAGFHEEVSPVLYTYVLPHVPNNYQIVNRCEVGAQFNGDWLIDADTWTTIVVKPPQIILPDKLPTTGF